MYAICRNNKGYETTLVLGRPYAAWPDKKTKGQYRVIDETHQEASYPAECFETPENGK